MHDWSFSIANNNSTFSQDEWHLWNMLLLKLCFFALLKELTHRYCLLYLMFIHAWMHIPQMSFVLGESRIIVFYWKTPVVHDWGTYNIVHFCETPIRHILKLWSYWASQHISRMKHLNAHEMSDISRNSSQSVELNTNRVSYLKSSLCACMRNLPWHARINHVTTANVLKSIPKDLSEKLVCFLL
jgi:hypothetical protein